MTVHRGAGERDFIIEQVLLSFPCRVLWSEGRPCLEYDSDEELNRIAAYVQTTYEVELLDIFFTAVESLPLDE